MRGGTNFSGELIMYYSSSKSHGDNRSKRINGDTISHTIIKKWYANNLHCARCYGEYAFVDKEKEADQKINVHAIFDGPR